jgi:hypothetical protein
VSDSDYNAKSFLTIQVSGKPIFVRPFCREIYFQATCSRKGYGLLKASGLDGRWVEIFAKMVVIR